MLLLMVLVFSSFIYWLEPRSNIPSMPGAIWFIVITLSTVGYGDVVPETAGGKFVTIICIVCGVLYMAMPISIVGTNFTTVWQDRDKLLLMTRTRQKLQNMGYSSDDVLAAFSEFDTNGRGEVGIDDF